ncbi:MAG TPA: nucleoside monophosphate kinase, partial [Verrucomicrobiae bacterium]|nr:nucleoside monophosphate kinase [Verrucomicrobiae bacterium]
PTIDLWRQAIGHATQAGRFHPATDLLVLDGIPRSLRQAEILQESLDVKAVFNLCCSEPKNLVRRLQRRALRDNRLDDANMDVIERRLQVYEEETKPLLEFYGKEIVYQIDATQSAAEVIYEILHYATRFQKAA